jgi:hypothetical protein
LSLVKLAEKMVEKGQKEKGELYRGGISPAMIDATLREGSYLVPATGISVSAKGIASAVYCGGKHSGFCRTEDKEVTLEQKLIMKKLTTVPLSTLLRVRITPRPSPLQDSGNVGPEPSSAGASSSSSSRSSSSSSGDVATAAHPVIPPRAVFCPSCRMRLPGGITVQQHWSDFHFGPLPEKFAGASSSSSSTSDREAAAAEKAAPAPEGPAARRLRPLWIQEVNRKEYGQDDEEVGNDLDLPEHEFVAHLFQAFELGGDHVWVACAAQTGSSSGVDGLPLFLEFEIFQRQHFPGHAMREPCCLLITGNRLATELAWTVKSNADGVGPQAKVRLEMLLHTVCRRFGVEVHTDERTGLERENGLVPLSKMRVDAAEVLSADVFAEAIREAAAQKESTALKRKEKQAKKKETSEKDKPKQNERKGEKQGEEEKKDESEGGEEDDSDDVFAAHHKPAVVKASAKPRLRRAQERSSEGEDSDQVFGAARRPTPKEKQQQPKEKLPAPRIRRVRTRRGRVFHGRPRDEEEVLVDSDGGRDSGEDSDGSVGSEGSLRELERHWGRIDLLEENLSEDEDEKQKEEDEAASGNRLGETCPQLGATGVLPPHGHGAQDFARSAPSGMLVDSKFGEGRLDDCDGQDCRDRLGQDVPRLHCHREGASGWGSQFSRTSFLLYSYFLFLVGLCCGQFFLFLWLLMFPFWCSCLGIECLRCQGHSPCVCIFIFPFSCPGVPRTSTRLCCFSKGCTFTRR